jgi:DNA polymerase III subunit delta
LPTTQIPVLGPALVYILHGDDDFAIARAVDELYKSLGDPGTADLNSSRLDGRQVGEDEIRIAVSTMPFLASRRLAIIDHPLARMKERGHVRFLNLLEELPPSAALVLVIEDQRRRKKIGNDWVQVWEVLQKHSSGKKHWLIEWAINAGERASIHEFPLPEQGEMPDWIIRHARSRNGQFSRGGAQALAGFVENNTRLAALEIEKLLTYVDYQRAVESADVELLTASVHQSSVFDLVDTLAQGGTQEAMHLLHNLLETDEPDLLFAMVVRQFRLLLQTREVLDEGGNAAQVAKEVSEVRFQFIANKLVSQAQRFKMPKLEMIYHTLRDMDEQIKTGQISPDLALELFISELGESSSVIQIARSPSSRLSQV